MGQWVAAAFTWGFVFNPRMARLIAAMFNIVAIADFLQTAYSTAISLSSRAQPRQE